MDGSRDGAIQLKADSEAVARHTNDPENKYKGLLRACNTVSQNIYDSKHGIPTMIKNKCQFF